MAVVCLLWQARLITCYVCVTCTCVPEFFALLNALLTSCVPGVPVLVFQLFRHLFVFVCNMLFYYESHNTCYLNLKDCLNDCTVVLRLPF